MTEAEIAFFRRVMEAGEAIQPAGDAVLAPEHGETLFCQFLDQLLLEATEDGSLDGPHNAMHYAFIFGAGYAIQFEGEAAN